MISISSQPFFMYSAFGGGQGGVDLIFRFLGNLYDFTPNLLHFIIVVLGESLEGDRRFIGIGQRGFNGFGHGIVGQGDFSAALVGSNHQTAAVYGARAGQGTIDFLAALLHFMLYRNGFIIIFVKVRVSRFRIWSPDQFTPASCTPHQVPCQGPPLRK